MDRKRLALLLFLCLLSSVSAMNEVNITVDSSGTDVCVGVKSALDGQGIQNYACDNETLSVSGTQDHFLFFVQNPGISSTPTAHEAVVYTIDTVPKSFFSFYLVFALIVIICVIYVVAHLF